MYKCNGVADPENTHKDLMRYHAEFGGSTVVGINWEPQIRPALKDFHPCDG